MKKEKRGRVCKAVIEAEIKKKGERRNVTDQEEEKENQTVLRGKKMFHRTGGEKPFDRSEGGQA